MRVNEANCGSNGKKDYGTFNCFHRLRIVNFMYSFDVSSPNNYNYPTYVRMSFEGLDVHSWKDFFPPMSSRFLLLRHHKTLLWHIKIFMGCSNEILLSGLLLQKDEDYVYERWNNTEKMGERLYILSEFPCPSWVFENDRGDHFSSSHGKITFEAV